VVIILDSSEYQLYHCNSPKGGTSEQHVFHYDTQQKQMGKNNPFFGLSYLQLS